MGVGGGWLVGGCVVGIRRRNPKGFEGWSLKRRGVVHHRLTLTQLLGSRTSAAHVHERSSTGALRPGAAAWDTTGTAAACGRSCRLTWLCDH